MKVIREARDASAERGNSGASGSGPGPAQAGPSRFPAPRAPAPRAPAAPTPTYRRNRDADVISQIEDMPCKTTVGQMFRIAPGPRHEFIQRLQGINNQGRPDRAQQAAPAEPRASRPILAPRAIPDPNGPRPMEAAFESEAMYHAETLKHASRNINLVVKGIVTIFDEPFEAIIDTGASDTVVSHSVVRRMGLMNKMERCKTTFLTAAGKIERPMGMLRRLPITLGSLTLELDCMVTPANNYNMLLGNDYLKMAEADILLSIGKLRVRHGVDEYEDIPIDSEGRQSRLNMVHTITRADDRAPRRREVLSGQQRAQLRSLMAAYMKEHQTEDRGCYNGAPMDSASEEEESEEEEEEEEQSSEISSDADVTMQVPDEDYDPVPSPISSTTFDHQGRLEALLNDYTDIWAIQADITEETSEDDDMPSLCATDESEDGAESLPEWYEEEVPVFDQVEEPARLEAEPAQTEQRQAQLYTMKTTPVAEPALADSSWQQHADFTNKRVPFPASMKGYKVGDTVPLLLQTYWTCNSIRAVLLIEDEQGKQHPLEFANEDLDAQERLYSSEEGECYAVLHFVHKFRPYLISTPFMVEMTGSTMQWLLAKLPSDRLNIWVSGLEEFDFKYRPKRGTRIALWGPTPTPKDPPEDTRHVMTLHGFATNDEEEHDTDLYGGRYTDMDIWETEDTAWGIRDTENDPPAGADRQPEVNAALRDATDWQFQTDVFRSYNLRHGPFDVDACADNQGHNAQCQKWWCPNDSYSQQSWSGMKIWCNPPFGEIAKVLEHATASYLQAPDSTSALFVLPDWPDSQWWQTMTSSGICHCVGYYPAGSSLFTAPPVGRGKRRDMGPTRWGVIMMLMGKPKGAGIRIPWTPWPPTQPPTIPNVAAPAVDTTNFEMPKINPELTEAKLTDMNSLIEAYIDVFASGPSTGRTNLVTHPIDTGDARPIKERPHRMAQSEQQIVREELLKMLGLGIVQHSDSEWTSNVVVVGKKDGTKRFCVDYRKLNDVTRKVSYPLPRPQEMLHELGPAAYFRKIDLKAGYWQVMVDPADRHKTAFKTKDGLFEFLVMPFGLTAAPATFQRLMDRVLGDLLWNGAMVYLDDIIVYSNTWEEHVSLLDEVFRRLRAAGLKASPGKCEFAQTSMQYLGHLVTREGVLPDRSNIKAILDCPAPKTRTQVRSFVGMVQYYGDYVELLAELAAPPVRAIQEGCALPLGT